MAPKSFELAKKKKKEAAGRKQNGDECASVYLRARARVCVLLGLIAVEFCTVAALEKGHKDEDLVGAFNL